MTSKVIIALANKSEFKELGELVINVYSKLEGFPQPDVYPDYYSTLANFGELVIDPSVKVFKAVYNQEILGMVIYFDNMEFYGSGGTAPEEKNAGGFRLLAVKESAKGKGVGRLLIEHCISLAKDSQHQNLIIHSTEAMKTARKIYDKYGFQRAVDLDFLHDGLDVFGYRLSL
ncbi:MULTISPECIES: GNAT family N-acetyltransferase [Flammeovirga]|uniref:GNAT family N-acetyltransferase n=1 Tax=Flammeovirga agarivorans TaxID=2726742 RepID=A0A7X8XWI4_9BACT|nr:MULTISPECIES: GNAT family N-acetyltransferase [Flammeovirga]NLR92135.1 GNAT family N-acetyltransferase [Flammeovirga agarivorans]